MADINTQTIQIDLNTGKIMPVAYTHQGDTQRTFVFKVLNNGSPYSLSGATVKFAYKSPNVNGEYTVIAGSSMATGTVSGNTVSVTLPAAYSNISGVALLTMIITPSSGTVRPVNIRLVVQPSADGPDSVSGSSDFPTTLEETVIDYLENDLGGFGVASVAETKSYLGIS